MFGLLLAFGCSDGGSALSADAAADAAVVDAAPMDAAIRLVTLDYRLGSDDIGCVAGEVATPPKLQRRDRKASTMGRIAVLPEIEPLPCAERQFAFEHRHRDRTLREDAANMRRHVVGPLVGVLENGIAFRNQPAHKALKVTSNDGIRIFAENERSARVMDEDVAQAAEHT